MCYLLNGKYNNENIKPEKSMVPSKSNSTIELSSPNYVPVIKDSNTYYGGSQIWFPADRWFSKDYILHNYGCGTIATADLFLYLALQNKNRNTPETEIALRGSNQIIYDNYDSYVRTIHDQYTKTQPIIAVLGTKIASAFNAYSRAYGFDLQAAWKLKLTYYDMLDIMEEMLSQDIPVILSIGPNTPNLWGKKGIFFYEYREIEYVEMDEKPCEDGTSSEATKPAEKKKPYYYRVVKQDVNSHYVIVTGIIKDDIAGRIMLRISSWGKQYYINYEEYRDYIDCSGGTFTSSIVQIKKID
jgi:hypothetical protein